MDDVSESEDEVITRHLKQRISDLIDGYQAADSKAVLFLAEANRLKQRLTIAAEEKKSMLEELSESKQLVCKLRDDLNTSVRNYETQLVTMSDHLANESEKWSQQQLELDNLKELTNSNYNRVSSITISINIFSYNSSTINRGPKNKGAKFHIYCNSEVNCWYYLLINNSLFTQDGEI